MYSNVLPQVKGAPTILSCHTLLPYSPAQARFGLERIAEVYASTEGNANLANTEGREGAVGFISPLLAPMCVAVPIALCALLAPTVHDLMPIPHVARQVMSDRGPCLLPAHAILPTLNRPHVAALSYGPRLIAYD